MSVSQDRIITIMGIFPMFWILNQSIKEAGGYADRQLDDKDYFLLYQLGANQLLFNERA